MGCVGACAVGCGELRDEAAGVGVGAVVAVGRVGAEGGAGVEVEGVGGTVWTLGWWVGVEAEASRLVGLRGMLVMVWVARI